MKTFRGIKFFADNARNFRIAQSQTGNVDTANNLVSAPTDEIISYDDFPRNGRILMRVPVVQNPLATSTEVYIPNITFWRNGDPNMDRNLTKPLGALSLGNAKLSLIRTYNNQDLLCTDELTASISTDTLTVTGHTFVDGQLVYFTENITEKTDIYTVSNASGSTCKLRASTASAVASSYSVSSAKIRVFNTFSGSLRACSVNGSNIRSGASSAVAQNNDVVLVLGDGLKGILPQSSALDCAVFGQSDLVNIQENKRYKVVNYTDSTIDTFQLANLESSSARSFTLGSAKVCVVANIGTSLVSMDIKARHTQRLGDDFPLGGYRQTDPNQIVVYTGRGRALPLFVWFLIDIFDTLDGDYRYTIETVPSMEEMLYTIDNRTPTTGVVSTGNSLG